MPSVSARQQRFMGADLARARAGEKTKTGMSATQLADFARAPIKLARGGEVGRASDSGYRAPNSHDERPASMVPFTESELQAGYRRLRVGFLPGFIGDPDHSGVREYGSSYEYNAGIPEDKHRIFRPGGRPL